MPTLEQYLSEYAKTHRHPVNHRIHLICVPAIVFSTLALGWCVDLSLFGLQAPWATWINASTVGGLASLLLFYRRMGTRASLLMIAWFALTVLLILAIQATPASLLWTAGSIWVIAWIGQLIGHHYEGAKPSFVDDLVFLLVGPLFVIDELGFRVSGQRQAPGI